MGEHRALTIRRDDHADDPLGRIFLDPAGEGEEGIMARLREYLGPKLKIVKAELMREHLTVEVESRGMSEESHRLSALALDLRLKGAHRNAFALFREALNLDPLNAEAARGLSTVLVDREQYDAALRVLKRARELAGDDFALLHELGQLCLRLDRIPSAIAYLERALDLQPTNLTVRRTLAGLGRTPRRAHQARLSAVGRRHKA